MRMSEAEVLSVGSADLAVVRIVSCPGTCDSLCLALTVPLAPRRAPSVHGEGRPLLIVSYLRSEQKRAAAREAGCTRFDVSVETCSPGEDRSRAQRCRDMPRAHWRTGVRGHVRWKLVCVRAWAGLPLAARLTWRVQCRVAEGEARGSRRHGIGLRLSTGHGCEGASLTVVSGRELPNPRPRCKPPCAALVHPGAMPAGSCGMGCDGR